MTCFAFHISESIKSGCGEIKANRKKINANPQNTNPQRAGLHYIPVIKVTLAGPKLTMCNQNESVFTTLLSYTGMKCKCIID